MQTLANISMFKLGEIDPIALFMLYCATTLAMSFWVFRLLRIGFASALFTAVGIDATALGMLTLRSVRQTPDFEMAFISGPDKGPVMILIVAGTMIAMTLGICLVAKVYRAVIMQKSTIEERQPGLPGVRAWLGPMNIVTLLVVTVAAGQAFDWSYFCVFIGGVLLLLAYPLVGNMQQSAAFETPTPQAAPEERQRVLALVESGKISAEDGAELLSALAQSQAAGNESAVAMTRPRRIMMLGAAVFLVGFFLPWFTEDVAREVGAMMNQVQQSMPMQLGQIPGSMPPQSLPAPLATVDRFIFRGGDLRNGFGWIALSAGLLAAILPFFWTERASDRKSIRNVTFALLGIGSIIMLYAVSSKFTPVTTIEPGFVVSMVGYVLLWLGGVREYVLPRPRISAALATA